MLLLLLLCYLFVCTTGTRTVFWHMKRTFEDAMLIETGDVSPPLRKARRKELLVLSRLRNALATLKQRRDVEAAEQKRFREDLSLLHGAGFFAPNDHQSDWQAIADADCAFALQLRRQHQEEDWLAIPVLYSASVKTMATTTTAASVATGPAPDNRATGSTACLSCGGRPCERFPPDTFLTDIIASFDFDASGEREPSLRLYAFPVGGFVDSPESRVFVVSHEKREWACPLCVAAVFRFYMKPLSSIECKLRGDRAVAP